VLLGHEGCIASAFAGDAQAVLVSLFSDPQAADALGVNWAEGVHWFNKERFEAVREAFTAAATIGAASGAQAPNESRAVRLDRLWDTAEDLRTRAEASGWRVERLLAAPPA
jgi:hypothetical protein